MGTTAMIKMTMSSSTATVQGTAGGGRRRRAKEQGTLDDIPPHKGCYEVQVPVHSLHSPALSLILLTRSVCRSTREETRSVLSAILSMRPEHVMSGGRGSGGEAQVGV